MNIEITKLQYLITKYPDEFISFYHNDTVIDGKKNKAGTQILLRHVNLLLEKGIKELDMQYDVTLYEYLSKEYPVEFRRPVRWVDLNKLEQSLIELDQINTQTKRKRFIYLVGDIYRNWTEGKTGQLEIVLKHGDKLDTQKVKSHRAYIHKDQKFFVRNSENGIIVFGETEADDYIDEKDLYRKKLDLIGSMTSHKFDKKFEISPDFIPNRDVYKVDAPGMLAEEYIKTNAKLIIFNEALTPAQKEALILVKRYDPFVRMMVIPPISPDNIDDILIQMKLVYNTDYWKK